MKNEYLVTIRDFIEGKIDVSIYLSTLEEWNRSGFWQELSKAEHKLMSDYFRVYVDMYYGETIPKFSFREKIKRKMEGLPEIDLKTLKKGTIDLLDALRKSSA